ncbi:DNA-binding protein [Micromonospora sp. NPDC047644]|uniref:DNA-binding protein n=1 Tax=Micromonospora sp. NPDC047644 TaxID=3157203 RepID=UPI0034517725
MAESTDLPSSLGKPALRALEGAGYTKLEQFTKISESEVKELHGMGPKALSTLKSSMKAKGLSFK